jgi:uncharacterized membrane protein
VTEPLEKETGRVEAFSDGVFAIAITLLILEIKVPHFPGGATNAQVFRALVALWPSYVAFLLSFFAILIMWINHHGLFRLIHRVDSPFLYANGAMLLLVTFVPFPTALLAAYLGQPGEHTATAAYCGTFVLVSIAFNAFWEVATGRGLLKRGVSEKHVAKIRNAYRFGLVVYVAAALLAFWHPAVGLGLCLSLWIFWIVLDYRGE